MFASEKRRRLCPSSTVNTQKHTHTHTAKETAVRTVILILFCFLIHSALVRNCTLSLLFVLFGVFVSRWFLRKRRRPRSTYIYPSEKVQRTYIKADFLKKPKKIETRLNFNARASVFQFSHSFLFKTETTKF